MNPLGPILLASGLISIALAIPLIRRRVKPNDFYGVRLPAAFVSEEAWFDLNEFGGRLLARWGASLCVWAVGVAILPRKWWVPAAIAATVWLLAALAVAVVLTFRRGARWRQPRS
jgi:hypothetical protein